MGFTDTIGGIGVGLILVAFMLNLLGVLGRVSPVYLWLNLVGAAVACFASLLIEFYPFVVLEAVWAAAAGLGLLRLQRLRSDPEEEP